MQNLRTAWILAAVLGSAACDNASTDPPLDPFVGRWSCGETRTLTFTTPAGSPDTTTRSTFVVNSDVADGQLTTWAMTDAAAPCKLSFKTTGTSALLMEGQSCVTADGITLTYKMGTADVGATGLHTSLLFDFAGALSSDGGAPLDSSGSGTTASLCAKMYASGGGGTPGGGGW